MKRCWTCNGLKWVPDGQIDDGRMTGRRTCFTCKGSGKVSDAQMLDYIRRIVTDELRHDQ